MIVTLIVILIQILLVMGFRAADGVPVRHREIFPSGLAERAQSSSRMSMSVTLTQVVFQFFG